MVTKKSKDFKKTLPAFRQEKEWQSEIDDAKREILGFGKKQKVTRTDAENANLARMARLVETATVEKKKLKRELRVVNTLLEALNQLMRDRAQGEEVESWKLASGITVYLRRDVYASITDKKLSMAYLKKTMKPAELFAMLSVHHSTYNAHVTRLLENGFEAPPGTSVFVKVSAICKGLNANGDGDDD